MSFYRDVNLHTNEFFYSLIRIQDKFISNLECKKNSVVCILTNTQEKINLFFFLFLAKTEHKVETVTPQFSKVKVKDFFHRLVCNMPNDLCHF